MGNLALNKPALQSSVSDWSSSRRAAEAAQGGNDGDLSLDFGIHTDGERDPWWQVDLQAFCAVDRVCVFNRDFFPERLLRFSVLGSLDGIVWDLLASKSDDRVFGPDGEPFVLDLPERPVLRFLRVRLDGLDCLHFKECQVFGTQADPDAAPRGRTDVPEPRRVVFSALYNESETFLHAYLANFLHYTGDESVLLVNLPPGRTVPEVAASERIILFNGETRRHKSGHTLLMGHLESYALALRRFETFDYFCPVASNSLFVRRFDPAAAIRQLRAGHKVPTDLDITYDIGLDIDRLPGNWHWPKIAENPPLVAFLKERWGIKRLSENQIEGLMAAHDDWGLLHARLAEFPEMGRLVPQEESKFLPLEEIFPSTFFLEFGSRRYVNICHVFWNRFNHTKSGRVTIDELLTFGKYPAHLCMMKWFERDARAVETALVTQEWSQTLLANFGKTLPGHGAGERLLQRLLLENLAASLGAHEVATPIATGWASWSADAHPSCTFHDPMLRAMRQTLHLPTSRDGSGSDAYLYLDYTQHQLDLSVRIEHKADTEIDLACRRLDPAPDGRAALMVEGYLYMRVSWHDTTPMIRVRIPSSQVGHAYVMQRIVVMQDNSYERVGALHMEMRSDSAEYYFSRPETRPNTGFWFGIPICADLQFQANVALIRNELSIQGAG